jgi:hypothetical protein
MVRELKSRPQNRTGQIPCPEVGGCIVVCLLMKEAPIDGLNNTLCECNEGKGREAKFRNPMVCKKQFSSCD